MSDQCPSRDHFEDPEQSLNDVNTNNQVPSGGAKKAYLKTINITIEDEEEDDHENDNDDDEDEDSSDMIWFDLDEFECNKLDSNSFVTAQTKAEFGSLAWNELNASPKNDAVTLRNSDTGQSGNSNELLNYLRQQKRIIWGEEVPCYTTSWSLDTVNPSNYIMTMGVNPLITIRPVSRNDTAKDDILITTSSSASASSSVSTSTSAVIQSKRIMDLDQLKNYFMLTEPDSMEHGNIRFNNYQYYLSLLDPSMPRLTNCGHYYRMRYAVYVMGKKSSQSKSMNHANWRTVCPETVGDSGLDSGGRARKSSQLIHIGEMHLYTIFPRDNTATASTNTKADMWTLGGGRVRDTPTTTATTSTSHQFTSTGKTITKLDHIHYENISFFLNQTPLTSDELTVLRIAECDLNQLAINFRRYLKYLNSIIVSVKTASLSLQTDHEHFNSTYLLEQLKYPKSSDQFTNPDRFCEHFIRNQTEMFTRYQQYYIGTSITSNVNSGNSNNSGNIYSHIADARIERTSVDFGDREQLTNRSIGLTTTATGIGSNMLNKTSTILSSSSSSSVQCSQLKDNTNCSKEMLTADMFVANLYRLVSKQHQQQQTKSIETN